MTVRAAAAVFECTDRCESAVFYAQGAQESTYLDTFHDWLCVHVSSC